MGFPASQAWLISLQKKLKRPLVLFLDFDGTLVPIVQRPELAVLDPSTRKLLHSLSRWIPVVIISGRALPDLKSRVGLAGVTHVGNHGLEMDGRALRYRMKDAARWRSFIRKLACQLRDNLEIIPGIVVENKRYTLSVHYRLVRGESRRKAARLFTTCLQPFIEKGLVQISPGKAVWEIRPPIHWHKGRAVIWILNQPAFQGRWPLYIGDDQTDQDALKVVRNRGLGIAVGPPQEKGAAHYAIDSPRAVYQFLRWLLNQVSEKRGILKKI